MTGFGRGEARSARVAVRVEARSVNHRYLDLSIRLPEALRGNEGELRRRAGGELHRGRVDITVDLQPLQASSAVTQLDAEALRAAAAELAAVAASSPELGLGPPSWGDLLRLQELARANRVEIAFDASELEAVDLALAGAMAGLLGSRSREGAGLRSVLEQLSTEFGARLGAIEALLPEVRAALLRRARERLVELLDELDTEIDEARFQQEVAHLTERLDVAEELERLRHHAVTFVTTCAQEGAVGRRLDFLVQEMLRELQTMSAKCRSTEVAAELLEAKVLADRLREQVQNVE